MQRHTTALGGLTGSCVPLGTSLPSLLARTDQGQQLGVMTAAPVSPSSGGLVKVLMVTNEARVQNMPYLRARATSHKHVVLTVV